MRSSVIRELLKFTQQPEVISFAGGLPAPELFPVKELEEATCKLLREKGPQALQYSTTEGYPPLREFIVEKMGRYGIKATLDNVLITHGSQQALDLIGKVSSTPAIPSCWKPPVMWEGSRPLPPIKPAISPCPSTMRG